MLLKHIFVPIKNSNHSLQIFKYVKTDSNVYKNLVNVDKLKKKYPNIHIPNINYHNLNKYCSTNQLSYNMICNNLPLSIYKEYNTLYYKVNKSPEEPLYLHFENNKYICWQIELDGIDHAIYYKLCS